MLLFLHKIKHTKPKIFLKVLSYTCADSSAQIKRIKIEIKFQQFLLFFHGFFLYETKNTKKKKKKKKTFIFSNSIGIPCGIHLHIHTHTYKYL